MTGITLKYKGTFAQIHCVDVVEHDFRFEPLGVLQKTLHQFRTLHAVDVSGPVVHFRGCHKLAPLRHASDEQRIEVGARRIDRRRVPCGSGAKYQNLGVFVG